MLIRHSVARIIRLVSEGVTVGKIGEVDEMDERELVLVVSVRCGKRRDMTRGRQMFLRIQRCAILELEPREFA